MGPGSYRGAIAGRMRAERIRGRDWHTSRSCPNTVTGMPDRPAGALPPGEEEAVIGFTSLRLRAVEALKARGEMPSLAYYATRPELESIVACDEWCDEVVARLKDRYQRALRERLAGERLRRKEAKR